MIFFTFSTDIGYLICQLYGDYFKLTVPVSSVLTVIPSNTVVKLGQRTVEFKCTISNYLDEAADWWWVPAGGTELLPIFQSKTLVYIYENHMEVVKGPQGQYSLVIHNVTFSDAGNYTCYDDARLQTAVDKGYFASAELVVIGRLKSLLKVTINLTIVYFVHSLYYEDDNNYFKSFFFFKYCNIKKLLNILCVT